LACWSGAGRLYFISPFWSAVILVLALALDAPYRLESLTAQEYKAYKSGAVLITGGWVARGCDEDDHHRQRQQSWRGLLSISPQHHL
jgi:hypothetical protein